MSAVTGQRVETGGVTRVVGDLLLGIRLSVGGGRTAWVRLVLTAVGIGVGVALLLTAASASTAINQREGRTHARAVEMRGEAGTAAPSAGDPMYVTWGGTSYRGMGINGKYLKPGGPTAPLPPGVSVLPGPGESVVSPALAELLAAPEGELLRPRFPHVVGTIADEGLSGPHELYYYAGTDVVGEGWGGQAVYRFGAPAQDQQLSPVLWMLVVVGIVVLLFPVLVFVGIATRLAGAQRDRRLAALRLIGASAGRVRLIAAGETLAGALIGLVLGTSLFLVARRFAGAVEVRDYSFFPSDLTPAWPLAALIVVLVPVLAVVTAVVAMRRTVVEPLGVVRLAKPVRRRLWWRLIAPVLGVGVLLTTTGRGRDENMVVGGVILLLLAIPLLLPWLVERVVVRWSPSWPSWQLAVRRLQLDSGTPARVVGGVAVVLAGAITMQTLLATAESNTGGAGWASRQANPDNNSVVTVGLEGPAMNRPDAVVEQLGTIEGVASTAAISSVSAEVDDIPDSHVTVLVGSCAALATQATISDCRDGDTFSMTEEGGRPAEQLVLEPGAQLSFAEWRAGKEVPGPKWTVPAGVRQVDVRRNGMQRWSGSLVLVTPAALGGVQLPVMSVSIDVTMTGLRPEAVEHVRNALAPLGWQANAYVRSGPELSDDQQTYLAIRATLLAGALLTLLVASASLLVLALEQVRERRRPLAVLAASGVPRSTLAWSLLWQNAVPALVAVVLAVACGMGLGALLLNILSEPVVFDWAGIGVFSAATAVVVLLVTALTLPALRRATTATGLRAE